VRCWWLRGVKGINIFFMLLVSEKRKLFFSRLDSPYKKDTMKGKVHSKTNVRLCNVRLILYHLENYDVTLKDTSVSREPIDQDDVPFLQLELRDMNYSDYCDYFPFYLSQNGIRALLVFVNYNKDSINYRRVLTTRANFHGDTTPQSSFEDKTYEEMMSFYRSRN
jgi:hypothetical protein